jgi:NAD(P)-dependent dehydrogenase (short-subunit alcohol dehydrogenase family)
MKAASEGYSTVTTASHQGRSPSPMTIWRAALWADTELSDWKRLIDINLMGVVHGCHFFVPRMVQRGRGGHVVNVASQAGFQANMALNAYSATKFAVFGFSEALRAELDPHRIGVTAVCPGVVNPARRGAQSRGRTGDARGAYGLRSLACSTATLALDLGKASRRRQVDARQDRPEAISRGPRSPGRRRLGPMGRP